MRPFDSMDQTMKILSTPVLKLKKRNSRISSIKQRSLKKPKPPKTVKKKKKLKKSIVNRVPLSYQTPTKMDI